MSVDHRASSFPITMKARSLPMRWRNSCRSRDLPMPGSATTSMTRSCGAGLVESTLQHLQFMFTPDKGAETARVQCLEAACHRSSAAVPSRRAPVRGYP